MRTPEISFQKETNSVEEGQRVDTLNNKRQERHPMSEVSTRVGIHLDEPSIEATDIKNLNTKNEAEEKLLKERSIKEKDDLTSDPQKKGEEGITQVDALDKVAEECDVSQKESFRSKT